MTATQTSELVLYKNEGTIHEEAVHLGVFSTKADLLAAYKLEKTKQSGRLQMRVDDCPIDP